MNKNLPVFVCPGFFLAAYTAATPELTATPAPTPTPMPSPTPEWEHAGWKIV